MSMKPKVLCVDPGCVYILLVLSVVIRWSTSICLAHCQQALCNQCMCYTECMQSYLTTHASFWYSTVGVVLKDSTVFLDIAFTDIIICHGCTEA